MEASSRRVEWRRHLGNLEMFFLSALLVYVAVRLSGLSLLWRWSALAILVSSGIWLVARWLRRLVRVVIWKLRNRLLVAYLFIAVVPILLLLALVTEASRNLAGQIAVYLVNAELERRVSLLRSIAGSVARAPDEQRNVTVQRFAHLLDDIFPGFQLHVFGAKEFRYPPGSSFARPPPGWQNADGLVVQEDKLFAWTHVVEQGREATIAVPLSRKWLAGLVPGIGAVSIVHFPDPGAAPPRRRLQLRLQDTGAETGDENFLPPPVNRFDIDLLWGTRVPIALWDSPSSSEHGLLGVHSRFSAVVRVLFAQRVQSGALLPLLYGLAILVLVAELISLVIGFSITRTITEAVHELYEGTQRVMRGDFSHRIQVRGDDQIAELSRSFNRMTENIENLLEVAKEKERLQADLEIAREVQRQLFPRTLPALPNLELRALCNPARMVSGDYYDFPSLNELQIAMALGDVAGKGISAALLMATLQSALRTQLRESRELADSQGSPLVFLSSRVVSKINQQLYADTAPEKYATFYLAIYDDLTGVLTYTNAGHLPPLLVRGSQVIRLDVNCLVVGAFPFAKYDESSITMEPGDLLVCYTDGVTEPENEYGEMFGENRLIETIVKNADMPLDAVLAAVVEDVRRFTGSPELQDDMTLLVARRL